MKNKLRIGFEAKRVFHNFRGLGNYGRTLIEGLDFYAPEHQKILYTPKFNESSSKDFLSKLKSVEVKSPKGIIGKLSGSLWRRYGITKELKKIDLDLFHGLSHELPVGIEKCDLKRVVTIHDLIFLRYPEFFPWIDRKIYFQKFKHSIEVSDKVLAICEQTKQDIIHYFQTSESKIEVVYQSCHPRFYGPWNEAQKVKLRSKYSLEKPYILYVGAFEKRKNIINLIHSFAKLSHLYAHDLILVGSGRSYKQRMLELIDHYHLRERIKLFENVPSDDLPGIYQCAELFVFPSFFEGFGIPIVEALFSSVPVITSHGSCFPESGGPDSLYTDPNKVEELTEAIGYVLSHPEKSADMRLRGREFVEKFHLKNTTKNLQDFYYSVISQ